MPDAGRHPQDVLEAHLNHLARKAVGETWPQEQARQDVQQARGLIGSAQKLYRGALAFYLRGRDVECSMRAACSSSACCSTPACNRCVKDEVAPLNSYLRWLPCVFDPAADKRQWWHQLMFAQHAANLAPVWGRSRGTGHPGITFFNRGGGPITFDPLNRLDRQMNAHLFCSAPRVRAKRDAQQHPESGDGDLSAAPVHRRGGQQLRPVRRLRGAAGPHRASGEARAGRGRQSGSVRRRLAPGRYAEPGTDAGRRCARRRPDRCRHGSGRRRAARRCSASWEITARLMITGGEDKEEARMTRADRSLIRQCILDAAQRCVEEKRTY